MTIEILYAFGSVIIVSLISLIGIFTISINDKKLQKWIFAMVALAIGALLGDAFIHLIPESLENSQNTAFTSLQIIGGILLFLILERGLKWHHTHNEPDHEKRRHAINLRTIGQIIIVSDGFHNLIDGIIIGTSYFVSIEVGIATTIAIILHEIPQEIGDFGVLIHAGFTKSRALLVNFLSALAAVIGVILSFFLNSSDMVLSWILPIAAGAFIYIASSDLVPELKNQKDTKGFFGEFFAILIGIAAMYLLTFLEIG